VAKKPELLNIVELFLRPAPDADSAPLIEHLADSLEETYANRQLQSLVRRQFSDSAEDEDPARSLLFDLLRLHAKTHQELLRLARGHGRRQARAARNNLAALVLQPGVIDLESHANADEPVTCAFVIENRADLPQWMIFHPLDLHGAKLARPRSLPATYRLLGRELAVQVGYDAKLEIDPHTWAPCEMTFKPYEAAIDPGNYVLRGQIDASPTIQLQIRHTQGQRP
jgi:hypothetical protein